MTGHYGSDDSDLNNCGIHHAGQHRHQIVHVVGLGVHHRQGVDLVDVLSNLVSKPDQRLPSGALSAGFFDDACADVDQWLNREHAAQQGLGVTDSAALLEVLKGVDGGVDPGAVPEVLS